jgi:hypothetical protein
MEGLVGYKKIFVLIDSDRGRPHYLSVPGAATAELAKILVVGGTYRNPFIEHDIAHLHGTPVQDVQDPVTAHAYVNGMEKPLAVYGAKPKGVAVSVTVSNGHF